MTILTKDSLYIHVHICQEIKWGGISGGQAHSLTNDFDNASMATSGSREYMLQTVATYGTKSQWSIPLAERNLWIINSDHFPPPPKLSNNRVADLARNQSHTLETNIYITEYDLWLCLPRCLGDKSSTLIYSDFGVWVFPHISLTSIQPKGVSYLDFRYLKCLVKKQGSLYDTNPKNEPYIIR